MARLKKKGEAGAAKAYVTRSAAVRKLQCSLADFRRLCILKGIFPREPRHKKRANKGSSAPTSFYYAKDIAYLAHEPVLQKLREHKAFAKKLARALGRGEWSSAKSLEENKPTYRLDHIIRERYPAFIDAVRDIDDALCMVFLFASLPSDGKVSPLLIDNCTKLAAEWQLYIMHSRSLRKVFLSIKGVYYQAEVLDQLVTWLVPYQFTQNIPPDVDVRVMLTFLEFYQTLLGFVLFKLYTDVGLVYPPPLDTKKEESAAGVGAFSLQEIRPTLPTLPAVQERPVVALSGKRISGKDVRQTIKAIGTASASSGAVEPRQVEEDTVPTIAETDDDFAPQMSSSNLRDIVALPTLRTLSTLPPSPGTNLFTPYTFWLSRETSRPIFECLVRSFGGRIGWPDTSGSGSPIEESDESITHVIIDRPLAQTETETDAERERRRRRKYVQPQWVADCINAGKILLEDLYAQGKTLPPHLSPFEAREGVYDPMAVISAEDLEIEDEERSTNEMGGEEETPESAALKAATTAEDATALRVAELEAEAAGVDYGVFERAAQMTRKNEDKGSKRKDEGEQEMNKMMMSNKQRKLYEKVKYSQRKREEERTKLESKRRLIEKAKKMKNGGT